MYQLLRPSWTCACGNGASCHPSSHCAWPNGGLPSSYHPSWQRPSCARNVSWAPWFHRLKTTGSRQDAANWTTGRGTNRQCIIATRTGLKYFLKNILWTWQVCNACTVARRDVPIAICENPTPNLDHSGFPIGGRNCQHDTTPGKGTFVQT